MASLFIERFLRFCCRWRKNRAKSRGFARSGALGLPGAGHGLAGGVLCVDSAHPPRMLYFIFHDLLQAM